MSDEKLLEELASLRQKINYHSYLYNTLDQPEISDFEYDQLFNRLKAIEAEHPELITPDSPTQKIGNQVSEKFQKVRHPAPILSLANGFGSQDALAWYERILRLDQRVGFFEEQRQAVRGLEMEPVDPDVLEPVKGLVV